MQGFLETRSRLRAEAAGDGGLDTCAVLTTALDGSIEHLFAAVPGDAAVVALGSYGRGELCLWSDVDLMLLHAGADTDRLVKAVFYPLWDANLKVGHSVRTVRECGAAARERIDSMTSLLSARLVAGDPSLLAELERELARVASGRPLAPHLAVLERERRRKEPYPVMAADVKSGRGALRTYQALGWERRRADLLGRAREEETVEERAARSTLLAVRNGLHASEGRAFDLYDFDVREPVARWLDRDVATVSRSLCRALQLGDRLAEKWWPDLLSSGDPVARLGRRVLGRVVRRRAPGQTVGPLGAAVTMAVGPAGLTPDAEGWASLAGSSGGSWSDSERRGLLDLIAAGEPGRVVFGWLEEAGWVHRDFPEWEAISAMPQLAPFHEHPVDAHLWRTTDEMIRLIREPDAIGAEIVADLDPAEELLLLSAFLHDIGKGVDGDHSEQGARVAAGFLERAGFASSTVGAVTAAVRHHLLLARTALRRDIASPEVIDEVAEAVGGIEILQILYLLTIADSRATGRTMWSEWKETLLRQLYLRVAARLEHGEAEPTVVEAEAVARLTMGRVRPETVDEHLAMLPADYAVATEPGEVVRQLEVISRLAEETILSVSESGEQVLVVGHDRRGFLLSVCRAFAANGIGVHDARLYTRADGVVIDVFEVRDDRTGATVEPDRWARVQTTLAGPEPDGPAVRDLVRQRAAAYDSRRQMPVTVRPRPELPQLNTVLEVRAADRVGLLVDVVEALYAEGLDLHLARIDTRANQAIDVLHVSRSGAPIRDDDGLADLCRRLEDRIRGQLSG